MSMNDLKTVDKAKILNKIASKIGGNDGLVISALMSDEIVQMYEDENAYYDHGREFEEWVLTNNVSVSTILDIEKTLLTL